MKKKSKTRNSLFRNTTLKKSKSKNKSHSVRKKSLHKKIPTVNIYKQPNFYVIFDLDETIISSTDTYPKTDISAFKHFKIGYRYQNNLVKNYVVVRPYFADLISTLKSIPNVKLCVWTSSEIEYAKSIVAGLEKTFSFNFDLKLFLARKNLVEHGNMVYYYYNMFSKKLYLDTPKKKFFPVKNLDFIFNNPDFKGEFTPYNTILIDDLKDNIAINSPKNVIWINSWTRSYHKNDKSLKVISEWFQKHRNDLSNLRKLELPKFRS